MVTLLAGLGLARNELLLFAGIGLLIGGLDDLLLDLLYFARRLWRSLTIYTRFPRMTAADLPAPGVVGPIAVFVPAWRESAVIGSMLRRCLSVWKDERLRVFVGAYPNDPDTIQAVAQVIADLSDSKVQLVVHSLPGPTTKADCLNQLWSALRSWEDATGEKVLTVVLHDAEDVVHPDALRVIGLLSPRFALVQLPVLPLVSKASRWVSGHYLDEFAEAHAKSLLVREALGAALPSAGVGCAFGRDALARIADARAQQPFDPQSLTEDYELGLRVGEGGGRGILVRMRDAHGEIIATREYFPDSFSAAVRQKSRWMIGISLAGWDRLGWSGGWREGWMRLRDRQAALAALIVASAYLGVLLATILTVVTWLTGIAVAPPTSTLLLLLGINLVLLAWRLAVRMAFVWQAYGFMEALRSVPRTAVGNVIALASAQRALLIYIGHLRGAPLRWDKTVHRFPEDSPAEAG